MTGDVVAGRVVGRRVLPIDWAERTAGRSAYAGDLDLDDALHVAIVRSPLAHARVERIDLARARRTPGFVAALTSEDFPADARYLHRGPPLSDRPPLAVDVVRFVGQEVCAIAATSSHAARSAADAVRLELTELDAPLTVAEARRPGAPTLHERTTTERNVSVHFLTDWGDVEAARAATVVEHGGTYRYPSVSHAVMEPNVTVARWHPEVARLELWTSTQAPFFVVKELANLLELPAESIVVREVAVGGGFGAKSKCAEHEVIAAALARKTGRCVVVQLTRDEEFALTKPRHSFTSSVSVGLDVDGRVALVDGVLEVDNGAYNHMGPSVMRVGAITLGSLYRPLGAHVDARLVDTATQPGGQYRGYGTPQVALAMESEIDEVAALAGLDPLEVRIRSANVDGSETLAGYRVTTSELTACLEAVREQLDWDVKRTLGGAGRGVGVAAAMHGSGAYAYPQANESEARVELTDDGRVQVAFGGADAGTGQRTIVAQIAAEALGVGVDDVDVVSMDGERTPLDLGAWSSRATHMSGHAVALAASAVRDRVVALAAAKLGTDAVTLDDGRAVTAHGDVPIGDLVRLDEHGPGDRISETSHYVLETTEPLAPGRTTANLSPTYCFAAHGAEVEVDERTGRVRVVDYVAAHDVGRPINPAMVEGQIIGGAVMGIGAALGEELIRSHGRVVNGAYLNYALPRAADAPAVRAVIVDGYDPAGPHGAKSVGEIPIIPPPPAIGNAIAHACGIRLRDAPFTPDKVLTALAERDGRRRRPTWWRRPGRLYVAAIRAAYPRGLHALLHHVGTRFARRVAPREIEEVTSPASLDAVLADLRTDDTHAVGGGTDLLLQRRQRLVAPRRLVSVTGVDALSGLRLTADGSLWIGAATTLQDVLDSPLTPPVVAEAVASIATPQVRAVATVAGNLVQAKRCWFYRNGFDCYQRGGPTCPCYAVLGDHRFQHAVIDAHRCQAVTPSDLATVLVALDAEVSIVGPRPRRVAATDLYTGPGETVLGDGDLIDHVSVPADSRHRAGAFRKLALYDGDFATASVAMTGHPANDGTLDDLRIVFGAMAPVPWRATTTERSLDGRPLDAEAARTAIDAELDRVAHPLPGNGWKLDAAAGLLQHAVDALAGRPARDTAAATTRSGSSTPTAVPGDIAR